MDSRILNHQFGVTTTSSPKHVPKHTHMFTMHSKNPMTLKKTPYKNETLIKNTENHHRKPYTLENLIFWTQKRKVWFRWFSSSNRWFSGSMLIFQGVATKRHPQSIPHPSNFTRRWKVTHIARCWNTFSSLWKAQNLFYVHGKSTSEIRPY